MSWACELTPDAKQDLRGLPQAIQKRVARVLAQMAADPFQGNVKALHGKEWKGVFRRRLGDYRLLFTAERETNTVYVLRVLLRRNAQRDRTSSTGPTRSPSTASPCSPVLGLTAAAELVS